MYDFGSSTALRSLFWEYTVFPAFNIVQTAKFAGISLVSILLGFFFIRLAYRFIILPLVGNADGISSHSDKAISNLKEKRNDYMRRKRRDDNNRRRRHG